MKSTVAKPRSRIILWLFLLVVLLVVWFIQTHPGRWPGLQAVPTVEVGELLKVVDRDVVYHRVEVPAAENSWPGIIEALALTPKVPPGDKMIATYEPESGVGPQNMSPADILKRKKSWEPALARLAEALKLPQCQIPALKDDDDKFAYLNPIKVMGKSLVARAKDELAAGHSDLAANDLLLCRALGTALRRCQGTADAHYLTGESICSLADRAVQLWVQNPHWRPADLKRLLTGWQQLPHSKDALVTSLQAEYTCIFLARLGSIQSFKRWWGGVVDPTDSEECAALDDAMGEVLMGRGRAFNRHATARDGSVIFAECIRNLSRPWASQVSAQAKLGPWRAGWPHTIDELIGPSAAKERKYVHEQLKGVDNALGKLFMTDWGLVFDGIDTMYFRGRTHWNATRIVLAAKLYAIDHGGKIPSKLGDLSSSTYLGEDPIDTFAEAPFHYDPARKVIWSVGQDGKDNGGKDAPGGEAHLADMVWALSPQPRVTRKPGRAAAGGGGRAMVQPRMVAPPNGPPPP